jgi:hypothetical protein
MSVYVCVCVCVCVYVCLLSALMFQSVCVCMFISTCVYMCVLICENLCCVCARLLANTRAMDDCIHLSRSSFFRSCFASFSSSAVAAFASC